MGLKRFVNKLGGRDLPPDYFKLFKKESESLINKIIDNASVLILYIYTDGKISLCNRLVEEILGKSRNEIIGKDWLKSFSREGVSVIKQQMFKAVIDDCIRYKRVNNYSGAVKDANNSNRLISWSLTPILSESQGVQGVLCIGTDVTAIKEKEASVKKIDETLKDILSNIREYALYATNLEGNIIYYGMGAGIIFGWKRDEIIFKHVGIFHSEEDIESRLPSIFKQVGEDGQYETEIELNKKGGHKFPAILTIYQFLDTGNNLVGYIFIAKDITERKKMEFQMLQSEKMVAVGQLSAGIAHEINNPLFVIAGRLEMLLAEDKLEEPHKEELNIIKAQTERIRLLVDRVLKFSRYEPLKIETININDVIEGVLPFLEYQRKPSVKVELTKDLAQHLPRIKGDFNQLQEVFINLLINAYQAMPQGGQITIATRSSNQDFVEIRINDTGSGIEAAALKNIFMPFYTTKKESTGLGLSITYNIIKNHNGSINIASKPAEGATFTIRLPVAKEEDNAVL